MAIMRSPTAARTAIIRCSDRCDQEIDAALTAGQLDLACPAVYDLYVHGYRDRVEWLVEIRLRRSVDGTQDSVRSRFLAHGYLNRRTSDRV